MSIEWFLIRETAMSWALIWLSRRALGYPTNRTAFLGALVAAASTALFFSFPAADGVRPIGAVILAAFACAPEERGFKGRFLALLAMTLLSGGAATALLRWMPGIPAFACAVPPLIALFFAKQAPRETRLKAKLRIVRAGRGITAKAIVDTGNSLCEPRSGLPVLILSHDAALPLLPSGYPEQLPPDWRIVRFRTLGGSGEMPCFRPSTIEIVDYRGSRAVPPMWVAIYPGQIPGRTEALAPQSLIHIN